MRTSTKSMPKLTGATDMLREDHKRIKGLFGEYLSAGRDAQQAIAKRCLDELEIHSSLEEHLFYPALRRVIDDKDPLFQAFEAHAVVDRLVEECRTLPFGRRFNGKFQVIIDAVVAHVKEEEAVLLAAAEASDLDLAVLGRDMALRRYELMSALAARDAAARGGGVFMKLLFGAGVAALAYYLVARRD